MILAALYVAVLIGAAILLGIVWAALKGVTYLWHQFRAGEKVNETVTK